MRFCERELSNSCVHSYVTLYAYGDAYFSELLHFHQLNQFMNFLVWTHIELTVSLLTFVLTIEHCRKFTVRIGFYCTVEFLMFCPWFWLKWNVYTLCSQIAQNSSQNVIRFTNFILNTIVNRAGRAIALNIWAKNF